MESRDRRLAANEAVYREVNERIREVSEEFGADGGPIEFVCECARETCSKRVELALAAYEAVRADPRRFAVAAGHELPEIESVVDRVGDCTIVEKKPGGPAETAEETNPR